MPMDEMVILHLLLGTQTHREYMYACMFLSSSDGDYHNLAHGGKLEKRESGRTDHYPRLATMPSHDPIQSRMSATEESESVSGIVVAPCSSRTCSHAYIVCLDKTPLDVLEASLASLLRLEPAFQELFTAAATALCPRRSLCRWFTWPQSCPTRRQSE
jgi:hypothetical protein